MLMFSGLMNVFYVNMQFGFLGVYIEMAIYCGPGCYNFADDENPSPF